MAKEVTALEGKVALVTGAARGLGAEMVRRMVAAGARVTAATWERARLRPPIEPLAPIVGVELDLALHPVQPGIQLGGAAGDDGQLVGLALEQGAEQA